MHTLHTPHATPLSTAIPSKGLVRPDLGTLPQNAERFCWANRPIVASLSLVASLALVACGGGSDATAPPGSVSAGATHSIAIQTAVSEPPLLTGSPKRLALDYLNRQRLQCGFGALSYSTVLADTGDHHASYALTNANHPQFHPHTEVAGLPGFTAPSPTERAVLRGYQTNGAEVGEIGIGSGQFMAPVDTYQAAPLQLLQMEGMRQLAVAPYHAMHFFAAYTEVGIGSAQKETPLPAEVVFVGSLPVTRPASVELDHAMYVMLGFGMAQLGQLPPSGSGVRTYPCEGSTDVAPVLLGEWTDPTLGPGVTPGRSLGTNPTGSTLTVIGEVGKTLTLKSLTLTRVLTGEPVAMYSVRTRANDPMSVYYRNDWTGYAMPDKALEPNERYRVQVSGSSGGVPFSRSFTFTTGVRTIAPMPS